MVWYIVCVFIGAFMGLFIAALLGAAAKGQQEHDLVQTWQDGYEAGKLVSRGKELLGMVRSKTKTYEPETDEWPD